MVKLRRRHCQCLGHVAATCDKFDNRRYVMKTGYRLETNLPAHRFNKHTLHVTRTLAHNEFPALKTFPAPCILHVARQHTKKHYLSPIFQWECLIRKVFRIGTVRYNWHMSAHASQGFSIAHCTDSEDLPLIQL